MTESKKPFFKKQQTSIVPEDEIKMTKIRQDFTPRDYQVEIAEAAFKENIVACLGTGTGKTYIAVMVIKELAHQIHPPYEQNGKRTFFLVPTVPLVIQQSNVLDRHLDLKIGKFYGDMNVDFWSKEQWHSEFSKNHILVMTAEIFRTIIEHGFLPLSHVNLIIFDECHRAVKNHPYRAIMRNFDLCKEKPKILGLTASILNGKCKPGQLDKKMRDLEATLRSKAIVPTSVADMQKYGTKPKEYIINYKDFVLHHQESKSLETILQVVMRDLPDTAVSSSRRSRDLDLDENSDSEEVNPYRDAKKYLNDVLDIFRNLGHWCARKIIGVFLKEILLTLEKGGLEDDKRKGLMMVRDAFRTSLNLFSQELDRDIESYLFGANCHPKLQKLLQILQSKNPLLLNGTRPLCGVIFVQKRLVAFILNYWVQELSKYPRYNFIKSNFMVGHGSQLYATEIKEICMASKQQEKTLKDFQGGSYNLLIASSVIEEGMDVPHCNLIVRFDPPSDFRAYVQSKGRARAQNSVYLLMTAEGEDKTRLLDDLNNYYSIEKILQLYCTNRELPTEEEIDAHMADEVKEPYMPFPEDGGARVTMSSAISLVNRYCSKLGSDSFSQMAPRWKIRKVDVEGWVAKGHQCVLQLPMLSPIREPIVGDVMATKTYAKMAAALDACKVLHINGELDDNLLPVKFQLELEDDYVDEKDLRLGASNQIAFYPRKIPEFTPVTANANCFMYVVRMKLTEAIPRKVEVAEPLFDPEKDSPYRFAIISAHSDLEVIPFPVYTKSGKMTVSIDKALKLTSFTSQQIELIGCFHKSTLTDYIKVSTFPILFGSAEECQYLLAPARKVSETPTKFSLDWKLMEKIKNDTSLTRENVICRYEKSMYSDAIVVPKTNKSDMFHVLKVASDKTVLSDFPKEDFQTYLDFFEIKHKASIVNVNDPLLELKHVENPVVNMPGYFNRKGEFIEQSEARLSRKVYFPPELVVVLPYPGSLFRQAACMPCVLSRINSLRYADELRLQVVREAGIGLEKSDWPELEFKRMVLPSSPSREKNFQKTITSDSNCVNPEIRFNNEPNIKTNPGPSPGFILEALTSKHYGDLMDLERLETIGDSLLKYATTKYLFCKYPRENEGKLTQRKTQQISNANLLKLGKAKDIPSVMCYSKMDPRLNWLPPGFKQPPGLEEAEVETGMLISSDWIRFEMPDIWAMSPEQIQVKVNAFKEKIDLALKSDNAGQIDFTKDTYSHKRASGLTLRKYNSIGNKSVADCVEALIGAYVISTGILGGLHFMNWIGLKVFPEGKKPCDLISCFTIPPQIVSNTPNYGELKSKYLSGLDSLEKSINYVFHNKMYLLEAIWHPSCDIEPITECYQRLEFLGDAVLDYIITRYLYEDPKSYSPGELTDLRMALVNNDFFAKLAVEKDVHKHVKYSSPSLLVAISKFVEKVTSKDMDFFEEVILNEPCDGAAEELEVPKVLGDVIESIAGAIYLDSGFSLQAVWDVFYCIMEKDMNAFRKAIPIHPVRQLYEKFAGNVKFHPPEMVQAGNKMKVKLCITTQNREFKFFGIANNKKTAKLTAAKIARKVFNYVSSR